MISADKHPDENPAVLRAAADLQAAENHPVLVQLFVHPVVVGRIDRKADLLRRAADSLLGPGSRSPPQRPC